MILLKYILWHISALKAICFRSKTNSNFKYRLSSITLVLISTLLITVLSITNVHAGENIYYTNPENNYNVVINDEANLLSQNEIIELNEIMIPITEYGNVAFISTNYNPHITSYYASEAFYDLFTYESGILFLIDMDNRMIYIYSNGHIYDIVTDKYAEIITDNVYTYASNREYYNCAANAYSQIYSLLNGQKIAMPMKYICNILFAIILSLLFNFGLIKIFSGKRRTSTREVLNGINVRCDINNAEAHFINQTQKYSPVSNGSSNGHSSSHSSSGGHSHHSGGGGGHKF